MKFLIYLPKFVKKFSEREQKIKRPHLAKDRKVDIFSVCFEVLKNKKFSVDRSNDSKNVSI